MYDPKSLKAEEFINDEEILDCLKYAKENKNNRRLIDEILKKAENMKGISHREAAVKSGGIGKYRIAESSEIAVELHFFELIACRSGISAYRTYIAVENDFLERRQTR